MPTLNPAQRSPSPSQEAGSSASGATFSYTVSTHRRVRVEDGVVVEDVELPVTIRCGTCNDEMRPSECGHVHCPFRP